MRKSAPGIKYLLWTLLFLLGTGVSHVYAQVPVPPDTSTAPFGGRNGTHVNVAADSSAKGGDFSADSSGLTLSDTTKAVVPHGKAKYDFRYHSPRKATWMSAVLPSLGQFYNKRYWKPPIIYAGLGVAIYFLVDNQLKFITARNSYRARVGVPGFTVNPKYQTYDADQIMSDRDYYRTNRDYSIIAVAAVYALNIIDAAVDAHLRTFDVGDDLSMKVRPSFQFANASYQTGFAPLPGVAWSLRF